MHHIFAIFVMICFTTIGFGLRCHECNTDEDGDDEDDQRKCFDGQGTDVDCIQHLWTYFIDINPVVYSPKFKDPTAKAAQEKAWNDQKLLCAKVFHLDSLDDVVFIERYCTVEGDQACRKQINKTEYAHLTEQCYFCDTDLCNAAIGSTQTLSIYHLFLPVSIIFLAIASIVQI